MFASYPKKTALIRIVREYRIFAEGYNVGNTSASMFREKSPDKQLPLGFIELANILAYPEKVENAEEAWKIILSVLKKREIGGICKEIPIESTGDAVRNILEA